MSAPAYTLLEIRRMVMAKFGDLVQLKATNTGTLTSFIDKNTIVGEPGRYAGREVRFLTGSNAGQDRYVTGSSRDTNSITFSQPLPFAPAIGDEADMTNAYGLGVTFHAVDMAINNALNIARNYALVETAYDVPDPFDGYGVHEVTIPTTYVAINAVMQQNPVTSAWSPVQRAHSFGDTGWSIDGVNRSIVINGSAGRGARNKRLRIYGYTLPMPLVNDSDTTTIDLDWLLNKATSHICLDTLLSRSASNDWASKGLFYQNQANDRISALSPNIGPNFVRI